MRIVNARRSTVCISVLLSILFVGAWWYTDSLLDIDTFPLVGDGVDTSYAESVLVPESAKSPPELSESEARPREPVIATLPENGRLVVAVVNAVGSPVSGELVRLVIWHDVTGRAESKTTRRCNALGFAEFNDVKPSRVGVSIYGQFGRESYAKGVIERGAELRLKLVMGQTRLVVGKVIDPRGLPAFGAEIEVRATGSTEVHVLARTDKSGRFEFSLGISNDWRVRATRDDLEVSRLRCVYTMSDIEPLLFQLRSPLVTRTVRIRMTSGAPIDGARLVIGPVWRGRLLQRTKGERKLGICEEPPRSYTTNSNGVVQVHLWGTTYEHCFVEARGFSSIVQELSFREDVVKEIIMYPQAEIYGRVLDPIALGKHFEITVMLKRRGRKWTVFADKSRRFSLVGIPVGPILIFASSFDGENSVANRRYVSSKLILSQGQRHLWNPVFESVKTTKRHLFLMGQGGRALSGYLVTELTRSASVSSPGSDAFVSNKVGMVRLPDGVVGIAVFRQGELFPRRVVRANRLVSFVGSGLEVDDRKGSSVKFNVQAGSEVRGRVTLKHVISGASIDVGLKNGRLRVESLPPGEFRFSVHVSGGVGTSHRELRCFTIVTLDGTAANVTLGSVVVKRDALARLGLSKESSVTWTVEN